MVSTEFWYAEGGSRAEGRSKNAPKSSKRWWLPIPQVPESGLSDSARKKLINHGRLVHQVFKAARSINQSVLLEMPVPTIIKDALPKVGKLPSQSLVASTLPIKKCYTSTCFKHGIHVE